MKRLVLLPGGDSDTFARHHWLFRQVCEEQVGPIQIFSVFAN